VTFTNRAAGEMRGRLRQLGAQGVQARTFHSAALRQLQYFWPKAIGGSMPRLVDRKVQLVADAAAACRIRLDRGELRDATAEIEWSKVTQTVAALQDRHDIAEQVRIQYQHFVVDEYQDVSPLQQRLLELWLGDRNNLCV